MIFIADNIYNLICTFKRVIWSCAREAKERRDSRYINLLSSIKEYRQVHSEMGK